MSERETFDFFDVCVLILVLIAFAATLVIRSELRDLQHRVGTLEQQVRR